MKEINIFSSSNVALDAGDMYKCYIFSVLGSFYKNIVRLMCTTLCLIIQFIL